MPVLNWPARHLYLAPDGHPSRRYRQLRSPAVAANVFDLLPRYADTHQLYSAPTRFDEQLICAKPSLRDILKSCRSRSAPASFHVAISNHLMVNMTA